VTPTGRPLVGVAGAVLWLRLRWVRARAAAGDSAKVAEDRSRPALSGASAVLALGGARHRMAMLVNFFHARGWSREALLLSGAEGVFFIAGIGGAARLLGVPCGHLARWISR